MFGFRFSVIQKQQVRRIRDCEPASLRKDAPARFNGLRTFVLIVSCICTAINVSSAQVSIGKSPTGWVLSNGHIQMMLVRAGHSVKLKSLRREGGAEWGVSGTPLLAVPDKAGKSYQFADDTIADVERGGKQLTLRFKCEDGGLLSLQLKLYPTGAVIQTAMQIENRGPHSLLLDAHVDPLFLTLKNPAGGLKVYSSAKSGHGFYPAAKGAAQHDFTDWLVLENEVAGESLLIGGEPGLGVLGWKASIRSTNVQSANAGTVVRAGTILIKEKDRNQNHDKKSGRLRPLNLRPGRRWKVRCLSSRWPGEIRTTRVMKTFRYLKQYVFQAPLPDSPLVTYCIWLTEKNSEDATAEGTRAWRRSGLRRFLS